MCEFHESAGICAQAAEKWWIRDNWASKNTVRKTKFCLCISLLAVRFFSLSNALAFVSSNIPHSPFCKLTFVHKTYFPLLSFSFFFFFFPPQSSSFPQGSCRRIISCSLSCYLCWFCLLSCDWWLSFWCLLFNFYKPNWHHPEAPLNGWSWNLDEWFLACLPLGWP